MTAFLVGGYTADSGGEAEGVGLARSLPDGRLEFQGVVARTPSPSWDLVLGDRLYTVDEGGDAVVAYEVADGELHELARQPVGGSGPCHLEVAGDRLLASCYGSGSLSVHRLSDELALAQRLDSSGSGPHEDQAHARAHSALALPDGRVLVADLGADRVFVHAWREDSLVRLAELALPAGTGPRDLALLADGRVLLLGQIANTLHLLAPDASADPDAAPALIAFVALPGAQHETHAAGIAVDEATGRIHVGLRRANRIAVVELTGEGDDTRFEVVGDVDCGGDWPRHLVLDGGVLHVANQLSSTLASFRVTGSGLPELIGEPTPAPSPTHLLAVRGRDWESLRPLLG